MTQLAGKRVFVAGHRGMVGSALVRRLASERCMIVTAPRAELDLCDPAAVQAWMARERPELVFIAAAKVGGILANENSPADFLYENLMIATNVIHAAHLTGVEKLLSLGSSCIYPKFATQPITEDQLLTGALEPTNQWYAIAKIAAVKLCDAYRLQYGHNFISAMPTNLYGSGDSYDPCNSHVMPALIRKAHCLKLGAADVLPIWGTGEPRREFLHADDCADACVFLMRHYSEIGHVNIGSGEDLRIIDLARLVCDVAGVEPRIELDKTKPDGTPRKLLDVSLLKSMGWNQTIGLRQGVQRTYDEYVAGLS